MARFRRGTRSSRRTIWCGTGAQEFTIGDTETNMREICPFEEISLLTGPTIVAVRGQIEATAVSASLTVGSGGLLTLGLLVLDAESAAAMINPADVDAADRSWLWRKTVHLGTRTTGVWNGSSVIVTTQHSGDHFFREDLKVKAMRRVPT